MSWSVSATGKIEAVRKAIAEQCEGAKPSIDGDNHSFVPGLIDDRLSKIAAYLETEAGKRYYDGASVGANGTAWDGGMSLSVNVSGTKLPG